MLILKTGSGLRLAALLSMAVTGGCIAQQDLGDRPSSDDAPLDPNHPGVRLGFDADPPPVPGLEGPAQPVGAPSPTCGCLPGLEVAGSAPQLTDFSPQGGYLCAPDNGFVELEPPYCGEDLTTCGDTCANIQHDPRHCGGCDEVCPVPGRGVRACVAGLCTSCGDGYTQCPGHGPWFTPRCMDLGTDLQHCGACGIACDGACVGGVCQPLAQLQLASDVQAEDLALDDDYVYFGSSHEGGAIARVHRAGGPRKILAEGASPIRIAVDDGFVYWSGQDAIYRVDRDGGETELVSTALLPWGLAVDDLFVYWAERGTSLTPPFSGSSIRRVAKSGGPSEVLADLPEQLGRELVVDETHVYFTHLASVDPDIGFVSRVLKWGGEVEFVSPAGAGHIALDATHVYGINGSLADTGLEAGTKAPSMVTSSLARLTESHAQRVAVSDEFVYFDGYRVPKCGGRIAQFVDGVLRMKAADGQLYWTFDGALYKRKE